MTLEPLEHRNTDNPTVGGTRKLLAQVTFSQRLTGSFVGLFNVCIFLRREKMGSEVWRPLWVQFLQFLGSNSHLDIHLVDGSEMSDPEVATNFI